VRRALAKDPETRYQRIDDFSHELRTLGPIDSPPIPEESMSTLERWNRIGMISALAVLIALISLSVFIQARSQWARVSAVPLIEQLDADGERYEAFEHALRARTYLADDPSFDAVWSRIAVPLTIETEPAGAHISIRRPVQSADWEHLGRSPLQDSWLPAAYLHVRADLPGFAPVERSVDLSEAGGWRWSEKPTIRLSLARQGDVPENMVRVEGGDVELRRLYFLEGPSLPVNDFFLDRYEVTNRDFLEFVKAGGYERREFWNVDIVENGTVLSWQEAMQGFQDATGQPGPSTWEFGRYRDGEDDLPVAGVSWYEADAYAAYAGKKLPTVYHWAWAVDALSNHWPSALGNFDGNGARATRQSLSLGPMGTYDAAGNVREWCRNAVEGSPGRRFILGGGWSDAEYMFREPDSRNGLERGPLNGFRCMRAIDGGAPPTSELAAPLQIRRRDYQAERPVSDEQFRSIKELYTYAKSPLEAEVERRGEPGGWYRQETVSFRAAYGDERVNVHLLLPVNTSPPFQTVVVFPAADAVFRRSSDNLVSTYTGFFTSFLARAGRAVVYPVYSGVYERRTDTDPAPGPSTQWREIVIQQYADLARTIDYLESRNDIDTEHLAFFGLSMGGWMAPIMLATETRFETAILCHGGLIPVQLLPEVDPLNFVPHVTLPLLMINGDQDHVFPVRESQEPLFRLLGTPRALKKRVLHGGGHSLLQNQVIRDSLQWLDEQLGPVAPENRDSPQ
jgi:eukaryotic-like serine/threonine-protein kinase